MAFSEEDKFMYGNRICSVWLGRLTGSDRVHDPSSIDLAMKLHYVKGLYSFSSHAAERLTPMRLKEPMFEWFCHEYYYTYGRLWKSEFGRPYLKCNDSGVRFIEAQCDKTIDEWLELDKDCWGSDSGWTTLTPTSPWKYVLPNSVSLYLRESKVDSCSTGKAFSTLQASTVGLRKALRLMRQNLQLSEALVIGVWIAGFQTGFETFVRVIRDRLTEADFPNLNWDDHRLSSKAGPLWQRSLMRWEEAGVPCAAVQEVASTDPRVEQIGTSLSVMQTSDATIGSAIPPSCPSLAMTGVEGRSSGVIGGKWEVRRARVRRRTLLRRFPGDFAILRFHAMGTSDIDHLTTLPNDLVVDIVLKATKELVFDLLNIRGVCRIQRELSSKLIVCQSCLVMELPDFSKSLDQVRRFVELLLRHNNTDIIFLIGVHTMFVG
ncbi:Protein ECERIFERUM 26 [Morella rubra]|uniref:Protein ECERIFERUM 26 n=1 Tax=Morella rubra TaxID=262757 RepID=A0A6A1VL19_9ROSI|nr:Protein ECERIFERUM 26 [Morella rubra]KAB1213599.1 Protein ECERIFERUM 26 [Morella rubra]